MSPLNMERKKKMIKVKNLKKKFVKYKNKKEKEEFYANKDISFEVADGEIVGILRSKWSRKNNTFKNDSRYFRANRRSSRF